MLEIVSIERVAIQGMTKPLVCKADDGAQYLVKYANGVTVNGLVKEWLAGQIAQDFGFKIPEFVPAFLCQDLIVAYPHFIKYEVISKPIEGVVFASKWQASAEEFKLSNIDIVPLSLQQDLLVFDMWIGNDDRSLTALGGNVNLLWLMQEKDFYAIDHNMAFQNELKNDFLTSHVFRHSAGEQYPFDLIAREDYEQKLQKTLQKWDNYVASCPQEWLKSELFDLELDKIYQQLLKDARGALWDKLR